MNKNVINTKKYFIAAGISKENKVLAVLSSDKNEAPKVFYTGAKPQLGDKSESATSPSVKVELIDLSAQSQSKNVLLEFLNEIDEESVIYYYHRWKKKEGIGAEFDFVEIQDISIVEMMLKEVSQNSFEVKKILDILPFANIESLVAQYSGKNIDTLLSYMGVSMNLLQVDEEGSRYDILGYLLTKVYALSKIDKQGQLDKEIEVRGSVIEEYPNAQVKIGDTSAKIAKKILESKAVHTNMPKDRELCEYSYILPGAKDQDVIHENILSYIREKIISKYSRENGFEEFLEKFENIYDYFNDENNFNEHIVDGAVHISIKESDREKLSIPLYDKKGVATSSYVTFSLGGIHGSEYDKSKYEEFGGDIKSYPWVSEGVYVHSDFTSYYPNLLMNMGFLSADKEKGGVIRELLDKKDDAERRKEEVERSAVKLILNALTGAIASKYAGASSEDTNFNRPITALNMRIIGQFIAWYISQELAYAGACVVSVNTDGIYWSHVDKDITSHISEISNEFGLELKHMAGVKMISRNSNERFSITDAGKIKGSGRGVKNYTRNIYQKVPDGNIYIQKLIGDILKRSLTGDEVNAENLDMYIRKAGSVYRIKSNPGYKADLTNEETYLQWYQIIEENKGRKERYYIIRNDKNEERINITRDKYNKNIVDLNDDKNKHLRKYIKTIYSIGGALLYVDNNQNSKELYEDLSKGLLKEKSYRAMAYQKYLKDWSNVDSTKYDINSVDLLTPMREKRICPNCDIELILRKNNKSGNKFYACKNYPKCQHTEKRS